MTSPPKSVLVVSLRYFGDVLLTTPLIRALARGFPGAAIDVLVSGRAGEILEGNPDVRNVIAVPERPTLADQRSLVGKLWRRYDLAAVAETGDRPHAYGLLAARRRVGLLPEESQARWWKRPLLKHGVTFTEHEARIDGYRRLAEAMALPFESDIVVPTAGLSAAALAHRVGFETEHARYAVLNLAPRFRYKRWHAEGWHKLIEWLNAQGLSIAITGGIAAEERAYVREVMERSPVSMIDVAGRLRFGETADLLRGAALYVGPDTATSHLAAASGAPSVVLFGPTDPRLWGPLPRGGLDLPYAKVAPSQRRGNVLLIQEPSLSCVPCQQEGCERHRESYSACLDAMSALRVIAAAQTMLASTAGATSAPTLRS